MKVLKLLLSALLLAGCTSIQAENAATDTEMTVYRSPTCSCCGKWIEHVKSNHFAVKDIVSSDMDAIKEKYGIPDKLASCHTAIVDGYVIEGHVPAADIQKLLTSKPNVVGLSAPGMPMGSPGMEMGGSQDYDVVSFDKDGKVQVFSAHKASQ
ncbi:MAG: CopG family transcriptional regulator [Methylomonas sp.]|nr:MAG: CopG family transcriptional regulator [Methylomonas sp.]